MAAFCFTFLSSPGPVFEMNDGDGDGDGDDIEMNEWLNDTASNEQRATSTT